MRDNILLTKDFVSALSVDRFKVSKLHLYAVMRAIEIVSGASRRLPVDLRERHPDLPWRAIRDSGNFYRHQYDDVSEFQIWAVVHNRLPALLDTVMAAITLMEGRPPNPS